MARLQISGHYAYPAVRSDVTRRTSVLERPQPARCIECHADSLSSPLTQLYIPGVPGRVQRGSRGSRGFANTKNETNVPELYVKPITQHPVLCAGGSSRTNGSRYPPLSARRGLPGWLQPASSTSPWLFYQVSSEVFSKSSSVMSFIVIIEPQILHQLLNVSQGDVPMALLPDPTTAASERSSVKNRLTGSRRRGSGINRHRSRTVSKTSLRGRHRVRAHPGGVQGQSLCNQP